MEFTPEVELHTLFSMDARGRIVSTREPDPSRGPAFALIRDASQCAWAIGTAVEEETADEIDRLARDERPTSDFREAPRHAARYTSLLAGEVWSGPAFRFPDRFGSPPHVAEVQTLEPLLRHFRGWTEEELPERSPIAAVLDEGEAVSVCFCARRSEFAAEAGVETAAGYRGRGLAAMVTAGWAARIQTAGLLPIYSTSWENVASLAVARKLGLIACAQIWEVVGS